MILPGKELSYQRHFKRNELWLVSQGECTINNQKVLGYHEHQYIPVRMWHSIKNHTDKVCKIIEIQYGTECIEEDIERDK